MNDAPKKTVTVVNAGGRVALQPSPGVTIRKVGNKLARRMVRAEAKRAAREARRSAR